MPLIILFSAEPCSKNAGESWGKDSKQTVIPTSRRLDSFLYDAALLKYSKSKKTKKNI